MEQSPQALRTPTWRENWKIWSVIQGFDNLNYQTYAFCLGRKKLGSEEKIGVYHWILRKDSAFVVRWRCGELASARYPHLHRLPRDIFVVCGWRVRRFGYKLVLTGVWLLGSVARATGFTRSEMPPSSPVSSLRSNGMVPVVFDCGSVCRRDPEDDPCGLVCKRSLPC